MVDMLKGKRTAVIGGTGKLGAALVVAALADLSEPTTMPA